MKRSAKTNDLHISLVSLSYFFASMKCWPHLAGKYVSLLNAASVRLFLY